MVQINVISIQLTEDIVLGQHGVHVAKPAQPVTRSEPGIVTPRDLQMAGKTAPSWARHVKHSCANRGLHVMVSITHTARLCFLG